MCDGLSALLGSGDSAKAMVLLKQAQDAGKFTNPHLKVTGVLLCMYESSTKLAQEVVDDLQAYLDKSRGTSAPWAKARIFKTRIRRNSRRISSSAKAISSLKAVR